ncbi:hypothetical protein GQ55_1G261800 [Panicum hallii var. hallii]|uniref:Uncharacterized protein n=1 Tax=Panicum hallii var. hallii TaxID=1504633 RepID=A0A2T7F7M1_9POAL|nr:hypothetical protein GQ55_1G261800 [Panicum hallii var. hallii]
MEDDDDFTFPTVPAAREPEGQLGGPPVARLLHQLPLPDLAAASSPLWPFAGSPKATVTADGDGRRADEADGDQEERGAAAVEEGMDLLWEGATAITAAPQSAGSGAVHAAEPEPPEPKPAPRRTEADGDDKRRAAAVADAERMDKLWESFNEELLLLRRPRTKPAADRNKDWYLCSYPPSDDADDSEDTSASSPAERRGYGCAPTMLRASSRAGGAGQFCGGSPRGGRRRGGGRGAAAGWALLLRLFRRLFAVDKATTASRTHATIYVP